MYARVAKWEGADADALRAAAKEMAERAPSGPPEGVPAKGFTLLINPESGESLAVVLFDTEEDLRKGHETLEGMTPPDDGSGKRTSVDKYEVAIDIRM